MIKSRASGIDDGLRDTNESASSPGDDARRWRETDTEARTFEL